MKDLCPHQIITIDFSSTTEAKFFVYMIENDGVGSIEVVHNGAIEIFPTSKVFYEFYGAHPGADNFDEWNW